MTRAGLWLLVVFVGALLGGAPNIANAQKRGRAAGAKVDKAKDKPGAGEPGAGGADQEIKAKVERTAGGGKVIKLTPILVEGKVQKPLALVLARSAIQYQWEQLKQDFTPRILDAVSKSPF
jgi:hypothetical protein